MESLQNTPWFVFRHLSQQVPNLSVTLQNNHGCVKVKWIPGDREQSRPGILRRLASEKNSKASIFLDWELEG